MFFPEFLKRLLGAVGAPAGVIWRKSSTGNVTVCVTQGLEVTGYRENSQADEMNVALLKNVFESGHSQMFGADECSSLPTPTYHLYLLTPLMLGKICWGLVEVFQRRDTDPRARAGYLQFIEQMSGFATRYIHARQNWK